MKVLCFGSLNLDYVYQLDHIVRPGETISSTGLEVHNGGKGLNQAIAMAKAGCPVYMAGQVGEDGARLTEACRRSGVNADFVRVAGERTGNAIIQVDRNGQNSIVLFPGSNRTISRAFVDEVLSHFEPGDLLVLQNEINQLDYLVDRAHEVGMTIVLNPSPFDRRVLECDLRKIGYFFVNEIEGYMLTDRKAPEEIMDELLHRYPESRVVLTLGGDGSRYGAGAERLSQGIFPVQAVDTTAAGDTFLGYFIAALCRGERMQTALAVSALASSITVSRRGAADSIPLAAEVERRRAELNI